MNKVFFGISGNSKGDIIYHNWTEPDIKKGTSHEFVAITNFMNKPILITKFDNKGKYNFTATDVEYDYDSVNNKLYYYYNLNKSPEADYIEKNLKLGGKEFYNEIINSKVSNFEQIFLFSFMKSNSKDDAYIDLYGLKNKEFHALRNSNIKTYGTFSDFLDEYTKEKGHNK